MRVLLIEDDDTLGHALRDFIAAQGYSVDWVQDGESVFPTVQRQSYDLLILDLNLPGISGLDVLRQLQEGGRPIPVLILTARDGVEDRVAGLDAGADDYMTKPFELEELAARIRVFERRLTGQSPSTLEAGPLVFDPVGRQVRCNDERLPLSVREVSILEMLMARAGRVVTKKQIIDAMSAMEADFSENAVEVYIYRLRRRLESTGASIQTVRGFGYLLEVSAS